MSSFVQYRWVKYTAQKVKFSIKDFFSKCDQIRIFLRIWSHLLKKSLMERIDGELNKARENRTRQSIFSSFKAFFPNFLVKDGIGFLVLFLYI